MTSRASTVDRARGADIRHNDNPDLFAVWWDERWFKAPIVGWDAAPAVNGWQKMDVPGIGTLPTRCYTPHIERDLICGVDTGYIAYKDIGAFLYSRSRNQFYADSAWWDWQSLNTAINTFMEGIMEEVESGEYQQ